jgi:copper chaperone CopZ
VSRTVAVVEREYRVDGMTCEHCVAAVTREVGALAGISHVEVDLATGRLSVAGEDVSDDAVRAGVEEAGYSLAS